MTMVMVLVKASILLLAAGTVDGLLARRISARRATSSWRCSLAG